MARSEAPRGFRQRMSGLHTWCGLTCGWLLCAIFLTGTLSVFRDAITSWMVDKPLEAPGAQAVQGPSFWAAAAARLSADGQDAQFWRITLPETAGEPTQLVWRKPDRSEGQVWLNAQGQEVPRPPIRATEGGRHFMSFHYSLQGGIVGFWVVGWISMCALVAMVSGVIVHKRIFVDFFTFRPRKGQRSWLDAHNATAVLTLPFLFLIVYTGLAYFYTSYMPYPAQAAYGERGQASLDAELGGKGSPRRQRTGEAAPLPDLHALVTQAGPITGGVARVFVERPGDTSQVVRMWGPPPDSGRSGQMLNAPPSVAFDAQGRLFERQPAPEDKSMAQETMPVVRALHVVSFGGWSAKWLYFLCGMTGTVMIGTGAVLFSVKRRQRSQMEFGAATERVYRVIDALNVASLSGVALASIGYFYANRLLPLDLPQRASWEIRAFFAVWALSWLHAQWAGHRSWHQQWWLTALLCLGLPLLNLLTTGHSFWQYVDAGDGVRASVELTSMALGLLFAWTAHRARPRPDNQSRQRRATAPLPSMRPQDSLQPHSAVQVTRHG